MSVFISLTLCRYVVWIRLRRQQNSIGPTLVISGEMDDSVIFGTDCKALQLTLMHPVDTAKRAFPITVRNSQG